MQEFADGHVRGGREEDVDVVGHHDEGVEAAAGAVEVTQGVLDGAPGGGRAEEAFAVAGIEPAFGGFFEADAVFFGVGGGEGSGMGGEPAVAEATEFVEFAGGQGVGKAEGREAGGAAGLFPMGKVVAGRFDGVVGEKAGGIGFQAFFFFGVMIGCNSIWLYSNSKDRKAVPKALTINLGLFRTTRGYTYCTIAFTVITLILYILFW